MSKLGKFDWIILYALTGFVDIVQAIITLTGIGIIVNEAIEPIMAIFLAGYLQIRGFSILKNPSVVVSLFGVVGLGMVTGGIAPAWIVDVWWIQKIDRRNKSLYKQQEQQEALLLNNIRKPLYDSDGVRRPQNQDEITEPPKLNVDGIRPPRGGLK